MKKTLLNIFSLFLFAIACNTPPGSVRRHRTETFQEDSATCAEYVAWFDTIYANLPAPKDVKKVVCPEGEFDDLDIGTNGYVLFNNEDKPFLIFEPEELNRKSNYVSCFRYKKERSEWSEEPPFFFWSANPHDDDSLCMMARNIRYLQSQRYFSVFYNDEKKYVEPIIDSMVRTFIPGKISGYAVIVDFNTAKPVCAFHVKAESSKDVTYYSFLDSTMSVFNRAPATRGMKCDLWNNIRNEIRYKLFDSKTSQKKFIIEHDPIDK